MIISLPISKPADVVLIGAKDESAQSDQAEIDHFGQYHVKAY
jgi:hypothetical protein